MIRVIVELLPAGKASLARTLCVMNIGNDLTGTPTQGNYRVVALRQSKRGKPSGVWRTGIVTGFPRQRLNAWHLTHRALTALIGKDLPVPLDGAAKAKAIIHMLTVHPERQNTWVAQDLGAVDRSYVGRIREQLEAAGTIEVQDVLYAQDGSSIRRKR